MKTQNSTGQRALTKRDISFLKFLDNGTYSATSTLQLPQRDRLRKIIDFFEIVYYLIDSCYQLLKKKRTSVGKVAIENLANALTGKFPMVRIDFSKIIILQGKLAAPCATMYQNYG